MDLSSNSKKGVRQRELEFYKLRERIATLETRLADLNARMPAHSIPPALIMQLDEIEEELTQARNRLNRYDALNKNEESSVP